MKNRAKKIIAIGSGVCFWALGFVFLLSVTKPYTERIVIWLPDNYELENEVKNEVVSVMPAPIDNPNQSSEIFYSETGMESFKKLFGNREIVVSVKMEDAGYHNYGYFQIVYQTKVDCSDKSFIVVAKEYHRYNKKTLLEMRIRGRELFLKNKRNTNVMYPFSIIVFIVIVFAVFFYWADLNMLSKRDNN